MAMYLNKQTEKQLYFHTAGLNVFQKSFLRPYTFDGQVAQKPYYVA